MQASLKTDCLEITVRESREESIENEAFDTDTRVAWLISSLVMKSDITNKMGFLVLLVESLTQEGAFDGEGLSDLSPIIDDFIRRSYQHITVPPSK